MEITDRRQFDSDGERRTDLPEDEMRDAGAATVQAMPERKGYYHVAFVGQNFTVHAKSAEHALALVRYSIPDPGDPVQAAEIAAEIERRSHCQCSAACHPSGDCPATSEVGMLNRDGASAETPKRVCAGCRPTLEAMGWETSEGWAEREAALDLKASRTGGVF